MTTPPGSARAPRSASPHPTPGGAAMEAGSRGGEGVGCGREGVGVGRGRDAASPARRARSSVPSRRPASPHGSPPKVDYNRDASAEPPWTGVWAMWGTGRPWALGRGARLPGPPIFFFLFSRSPPCTPTPRPGRWACAPPSQPRPRAAAWSRRCRRGRAWRGRPPRAHRRPGWTRRASSWRLWASVSTPCSRPCAWAPWWRVGEGVGGWVGVPTG